MKKLFLMTACVAVLFSSCGKQEVKPFDVMDYDSVTVKDGAKNDVRLSIKFLLDSTANELIKSEDELNNFFERIVWNLQTECNYPLTFVPTQILSVECKDVIEYRGENIYNIVSLVKGKAKNAFGVEGEISDVLDLIAWREATVFESEGDEAPTEFVYWHILPNTDNFMKDFEEDIDRKLAGE